MHFFVCFHGILNGTGINMLGDVLKEKPSLELLVGQELFPVPQSLSTFPSFNSGVFVARRFLKQYSLKDHNSKIVMCLCVSLTCSV